MSFVLLALLGVALFAIYSVWQWGQTFPEGHPAKSIGDALATTGGSLFVLLPLVAIFGFIGLLVGGADAAISFFVVVWFAVMLWAWGRVAFTTIAYYRQEPSARPVRTLRAAVRPETSGQIHRPSASRSQPMPEPPRAEPQPSADAFAPER